MEIIGSGNNARAESGINTRQQGAANDSVARADVDFAAEKLFSELPAFAREISARDGYFWQRQQAAIRSLIAVGEASKQSWTGLLWIAALAMLLIVSLVTVNHSLPPSHPSAQNAGDPDQELLISVEEAVHSGVPEALEPAALLAEEIRSAESASSRKAKESSNAN